jgi:hypothetical protein
MMGSIVELTLAYSSADLGRDGDGCSSADLEL